MPASELAIRNLLHSGPVRYGDALTLQRDLVQLRQRGEISDTLLLLEHPPTVTYGKTAALSNLLLAPEQYEERGIELIATDRGGDVTYHGPGQLVGYPIIHLGDGRRDVHAYVRFLEDVLIQTACSYGIEEAARAHFHAGVWVRDGYLAALGVRISRWVTHHGFALNVTEEVRDGFATIVPCGVPGKEVATMTQWSDRVTSLGEVASSLAALFEEMHATSLRVSARLA